MCNNKKVLMYFNNANINVLSVNKNAFDRI